MRYPVIREGVAVLSVWKELQAAFPLLGMALPLVFLRQGTEKYAVSYFWVSLFLRAPCMRLAAYLDFEIGIDVVWEVRYVFRQGRE